MVRSLLTAFAASLLASAVLAQPIVIDGNTADWPEGEIVRCEDGWLKVKLDLGRVLSMHALPEPISLSFVVDRAGDGFDPTVSVAFSPPPPADGERRWGPYAVLATPDGFRDVSVMDLDLHVAPTAASKSYEIRVGVDELLEVTGLTAADSVSVRLDRFEGAPIVLGPIELCDTAPDTRGADLPARPANGVRAMAWNVLWSSPIESPDGFARIFEATRPDVVLFQEWDRGELSAEDVAGWMNEHAAWTEGTWSVSKPDAWGVAVATHYPMVAEGPEQLLAPGTRWDFPVRLASAVIDLPIGRTVVGSLHLKCCGSLGTEEDDRRLVESLAVRDTMIDLAVLHDAEHVILGGDFNTSGTLAVLDVSAAGVDLDGSPLTYAEPIVTADEARYTFGRPGMNNVRTRLDWIAYSDSTLNAISAFVIDTARVDAPSLASMGLVSTDSAASDHLPVVVDLVPTD
ncbi:MAG: endonuclease/exonuclease/phosphatase family protein [Planctomycetota bacterium]